MSWERKSGNRWAVPERWSERANADIGHSAQSEERTDTHNSLRKKNSKCSYFNTVRGCKKGMQRNFAHDSEKRERTDEGTKKIPDGDGDTKHNQGNGKRVKMENRAPMPEVAWHRDFEGWGRRPYDYGDYGGEWAYPQRGRGRGRGREWTPDMDYHDRRGGGGYPPRRN